MSHPLAILPPMMDDLARTEQELLRVVAADGDFLTDIASHLIEAGGKRVRPGFAMAAAASLDPSGSPATLDVIRGGCAVAAMYTFEQPGVYAYVNHNLIEGAMLGATAHFVVEGQWDNALMEQLVAPRSFET